MFNLNLNLIFDNINLLYSKFVIIGYYDFQSRNPIKFSILFYDDVNETLIDPNNLWDENCFIYRYLSIQHIHNQISVVPIPEKTIKIDGIEYNARINNCYVNNYINKLENYFGITYFLDIPYIPPDPRSVIFGVTRMFLN
jgi:hypothetical protein